MTKHTGIVIFFDDVRKEVDKLSAVVHCYFPKNPKKVIFVGAMVGRDMGRRHSVVMTLNGRQLDDNWSENIEDVKDELVRILPKNCHEMLA